MLRPDEQAADAKVPEWQKRQQEQASRPRPEPVNRKEDRPVVLYAGSLACLNAKLETFCASTANRNERVCQMYKQVYLNDATLLFTRLLRKKYREDLHETNFKKAAAKRVHYKREQFDKDLIDLQDAYIEFLQTTVLGLLFESGADLNNAPLHLLEPRELVRCAERLDAHDMRA